MRPDTHVGVPPTQAKNPNLYLKYKFPERSKKPGIPLVPQHKVKFHV